MREIKFRAWDEIGKWMGNVTSFDFDEGAVFIKTKHSDDENKFDINNVPVMQYTGLKDKDGREIFEGDLYKYTISHDMYNPESGHTTFEVVHVKAVTFEDGAFYHGTHLLSEIIEFDDSFTYVGNIYENHELLEESQNGTK
ncbi:YopX family protein [Lysinibacillus pakistanensis]|uniref:YopX family protein n=1 Tax=Lysinibacillus pakistanensis TaxID=759811 RepID=A0AAX3WZ02_9BACI|nr:YopX family protein [Lysinibacillus pakistanensis]MDM5231464.1 YopX family protein [Lysinibacillus pakistanensis]WHY47011.1 YopX family protein [Lysinibacillus pakistanensis]WHY52023.1 YopX family protein [Lysinibacillus pakistanensis]